MSYRLYSNLPLLKWKRISMLSHSEAADLTNGGTDKFMNKDFWVLGRFYKYNSESEMPIGTVAINYHDNHWWIVEKVVK